MHATQSTVNIATIICNSVNNYLLHGLPCHKLKVASLLTNSFIPDVKSLFLLSFILDDVKSLFCFLSYWMMYLSCSLMQRDDTALSH
jgi:hypothetical protein